VPDIKHFDPDRALASVERLFWRNGATATSIQAVAAATGLNRSSLYATFGDKRALYLAALCRYVDQRARPAFDELARDGRGVPAVRGFFHGLIDTRCSGEHAGWGCLIVNAHSGIEHNDPDVAALLDEHHRLLRNALHSALETAESAGQLRPDISITDAADTLALLAYGINLRSRGAADPVTLHQTATAAIDNLAK
jgi:TetR/AcrR family transcriptional regulator, transcriptional repressor for nem operon